MPGRNIYKEYVAESYYHIYNRGVNRSDIFLDTQDKEVFIGLFKRYLGSEVDTKKNRQPYPNYYNDVELLAFCLMRNHFHLFIYQENKTTITDFMKSLTVAYSMYFNTKYKRVGPVFQQRYRAVRITDDAQFQHITRYIHMNPRKYIAYKWSSLPYYLSHKKSSWLRPHKILTLFSSEQSYIKFLKEYESRRDELQAFKDELANN